MTQEIDLLVIDGTDGELFFVEQQAKKMGIDFVCDRAIRLVMTYGTRTLKPKIAIVHLSSDLTPGNGIQYCQGLMDSFPEITRRVLVSDATKTAERNTRAAIEFKADELVSKEQVEKNDLWLEGVMSRGLASPDEIIARGITVEINGERIKDIPIPEREVGSRRWRYNEGEYIKSAKERNT